MAKEIMTDFQVEQEIERLLNSDEVKLAKKEQAILNRRRQYMYSLRTLEKRGKLLSKKGITIDNIEAELFGDSSEE